MGRKKRNDITVFFEALRNHLKSQGIEILSDKDGELFTCSTIEGVKYLPVSSLEDMLISLIHGSEKFQHKLSNFFIREVIRFIQAMSKQSVAFTSGPVNLDLQRKSQELMNSINTIDSLLMIEKTENGFELVERPFSNREVHLNKIPIKRQIGSDCPTFQKFLIEMVHPEDVASLQEFMGSSLIPSTRFNKMLILFGEGANGKSVLIAIFIALLGADNISSVPMEGIDLQRTFLLAAMVGKLANVMDEMDELNRTREGALKIITSGGQITVERKFGQPFTASLYAKLVWATNILPRFSDRSDGIYRRLLIIHLRNQILDESKQNKDLVNPEFWINSGELPGIFEWATRGLLRLFENGKFSESEHSKKLRIAHRLDSNPAAQFIEDHLKENVNSAVSTGRLYGVYDLWCRLNGHRTVYQGIFTKEVLRKFRNASVTENPEYDPHLKRKSRFILGVELHSEPI